MITKTKKTGSAAIYGTAIKNKSNPSTIKSEMKKAINAAWISDDSTAKALQSSLFPAGKPEPEEFISVIVSLIVDKHGKNGPF